MAVPVALFWGEDDFLLRDAARAWLAETGVRAREVSGSDWEGGETSDLLTPSLWGERRALLVVGGQALRDAAAREVRSYLESPSPDAALALTWVSRSKGAPAVAKTIERVGGTVRNVQVKRQDLPRWVTGRAKARGLRMSAAAATALVDTVGEDPAALDQSVEQLATAFPGTAIGPEHVRSQFRGLGDQQIWDLCDLALGGRLPQALVALRGLLDAKEQPLFVLGGIASRVRDLLRVRSLPDRLPNDEAARVAGLRFEWQLRRYRELASRFTLEELESMHQVVSETDRALKCGVPGEVALTALVSELAGERGAALSLPAHLGR